MDGKDNEDILVQDIIPANIHNNFGNQFPPRIVQLDARDKSIVGAIITNRTRSSSRKSSCVRKYILGAVKDCDKDQIDYFLKHQTMQT